MSGNTLMESYNGYVLEEAVGTSESFQIDDDGKADWALRKLALAERAKAQRKAFVEGEIERLQTWQQKEDQHDDRSMVNLTSLLRAYFEHLQTAGILGKRKSYRLPHGMLASRHTAITWQIYDKQKLLEWASPLRLTRQKDPEPAWDAIKSRLAPTRDDGLGDAVDLITGEVVPGIRLEQPAHDEFKATPDVDLPF